MIDIESARAIPNYTRKELLKRVVWALVKPFFRFSPRPAFAWRNFILRSMGARIGHHVHIYSTARIYFPWNLTVGSWSAISEDVLIYNLGPVTIGEKVTLSHRAHLCAGTHDYMRSDLPLLKPPIHVQDQVWVCADAFVGPAVTIGEGAIVGARGVVVKDVEPWTIVGGNPARFIRKRPPVT